MKRRDFLKTAGVGGLGIVIGACAPAANPGPATPAAANTPESAAQAPTNAPAQVAKLAPTTQAATDETYVMVSNVAAHPYWLDAKYGGDDAAAQLGVKFVYTGPAAMDTPAQVTQIEQGREPDDMLDPEEIDPLTRRYLRDAFREVAAVQKTFAGRLEHR
jgi:hypothetical protein